MLRADLDVARDRAAVLRADLARARDEVFMADVNHAKRDAAVRRTKLNAANEEATAHQALLNRAKGEAFTAQLNRARVEAAARRAELNRAKEETTHPYITPATAEAGVQAGAETTAKLDEIRTTIESVLATFLQQAYQDEMAFLSELSRPFCFEPDSQPFAINATGSWTGIFEALKSGVTGVQALLADPMFGN